MTGNPENIVQNIVVPLFSNGKLVTAGGKARRLG
jgi:TATA-box binding protein (TBP) (component of TFIID and TFIIIB)